MQTSPSRAGASVPPLSLATTGSRLTTNNVNIHNAATAALTGSGASPTQNKTGKEKSPHATVHLFFNSPHKINNNPKLLFVYCMVYLLDKW
jgi:hypothetical protein